MSSRPSKDESDIQEALKAYFANNGDINIATIARDFNVDYQRLRRRTLGVQSMSKRRGANSALSKEEDEALVAMIQRWDTWGLPRSKDYVVGMANWLISQRDGSHKKPRKPLSRHWFQRWCNTHPDFVVKKETLFAVARNEPQYESSSGFASDDDQVLRTPTKKKHFEKQRAYIQEQLSFTNIDEDMNIAITKYLDGTAVLLRQKELAEQELYNNLRRSTARNRCRVNNMKAVSKFGPIEVTKGRRRIRERAEPEALQEQRKLARQSSQSSIQATPTIPSSHLHEFRI